MPSTKKRVITNVSWLMWERVFQLSISFFVSAWVARYLGPAQLGIINNILAYAMLFVPIATLSLDNIAIEKIVDNEGDKERILGTSWILKVIGTFVFIILSVLVVRFVYPGDVNMTFFMFIVSFGFLFRTVEVVDFWFQAKVDAKYPVIVRNVVFAISTLMRIALVVLGANLIWFIVVALIEAFVSFCGMIVIYKLKNERFRLWKFDWVLAKEMLKLSWPLIISGIAIGVFLRIDQVLIGRLLGSEQLGIYSVAVKFSELWNFIPSAIVVSVFPFILKVRKESVVKSRHFLFLLYTILIVFGLAVSIFFLLFSKVVVNFFYGAEFLGAIPVLQVYIWTLVFAGMGFANARYLVMVKNTKLSLVVTILGALCALGLNFWLVKSYGIIGGAFASTLSYAVVSVLPLLYLWTVKLIREGKKS